MNPIPIELIQDGPDWWVPWLPTLGSLIVASAAFFGVYLSNRTNRAAIEAADDREHKKWQREAILEAVNSAIDNSIAAEEGYHYTSRNRFFSDERDRMYPGEFHHSQEMDRLHAHTRAIATSASKLALLGADSARDACDKLRAHFLDEDYTNACATRSWHAQDNPATDEDKAQLDAAEKVLFRSGVRIKIARQELLGAARAELSALNAKRPSWPRRCMAAISRR